MPGVDGADTRQDPIVLHREIALPFGSDFAWLVPGLVLTLPGVLIILVVGLQALGALAWVPMIRRRLGSVEEMPGAVARRTTPPR